MLLISDIILKLRISMSRIFHDRYFIHFVSLIKLLDELFSMHLYIENIIKKICLA